MCDNEGAETPNLYIHRNCQHLVGDNSRRKPVPGPLGPGSSPSLGGDFDSVWVGGSLLAPVPLWTCLCLECGLLRLPAWPPMWRGIWPVGPPGWWISWPKWWPGSLPALACSIITIPPVKGTASDMILHPYTQGTRAHSHTAGGWVSLSFCRI